MSSEKGCSDEPLNRRAPCGRLLGRNRDFTAMWSGQAISAIGSGTSLISYPLLVLLLTGSPALAGVIMAERMITGLLASLPGGVLVDWYDKRRLMLICDLARAVAQGVVALAWLGGWLEPWVLVLTIAIESAFGSIFSSAEPPVIRHLVRPEQLKLALARNGSAQCWRHAHRPTVGRAVVRNRAVVAVCR